ncbi:MAG: hypothetical protein ACPLRY_04510 [Candidatus Bathyarchaeales archaeon]
MKSTEKAETPYLFFVILIPVIALNYLTIIQPILVELVILSSPLPTSKFDMWLVTYIFGAFTYNNYLLLWFGSYFLSFIIGSLLALFLSQPIFGKLLKKHEVIIGEIELAARTVFDFIIGAFFTYFTFDLILSFITAYPYELISHSIISYAVITGFLTGNVVLKCAFLLLIYFKCEKNALLIESVYLSDETGKRRYRKILWSLKKRPAYS